MSFNLIQNLRDEDLIEIIRATPAVYDRKNSGFKHRDVKHRAWLQIARNIPNCSLEDIQNRWKHLRERYSREKKSLQLLGDGTKKSSWPYFDHLTFLDPHILHRRTIKRRLKPSSTQNQVQCPDTFNDTDNSASSFSMKIEHMSEHSETEENDSNSENVEIDLLNNSKGPSLSLDDEDILDEMSSTAHGNYTYRQESDGRPLNKNMRFSSHDISTDASQDFPTALLLNVSSMMSDVTKTLAEHRNKAKKDEDEIFGELIAVTLRNFKSSQKKNQLKREIIDKLLNFSDAD